MLYIQYMADSAPPIIFSFFTLESFFRSPIKFNGIALWLARAYFISNNYKIKSCQFHLPDKISFKPTNKATYKLGGMGDWGTGTMSSWESSQSSAST